MSEVPGTPPVEENPNNVPANEGDPADTTSTGLPDDKMQQDITDSPSA